MMQRNQWLNVVGSLLALIALGGAMAGPSFASQTPEAMSDGQPGDLLRWEPIGAIGGHPVWRILYLSTDLNGELIPVTGLIAIPNGPPPAGGFPLLSVGHPTSGIGRQCAPSLILYEGSSMMAGLYENTLTPYLDAGFAIVMSDYQGLGAAGDPSYLIGAIEGRNVLDAIRAARQFPEAAFSDDLLLIGHSQGGHAVAFAVQLAPDYAPELRIDGAVLAGPPLDPRGIFADFLQRDERSLDTSLILFLAAAWTETYPEASLDEVTTAQGQELIEREIAGACLIEAGLASNRAAPSELFLPDAPAAWAGLIEANTPDPGPWEPPVLIVQGEQDEVIALSLTEAFIDQLCESGTTVDFRIYPDANHFGVLAAAEIDMLAWLQARVRGEAAPSDCHPP